MTLKESLTRIVHPSKEEIERRKGEMQERREGRRVRREEAQDRRLETSHKQIELQRSKVELARLRAEQRAYAPKPPSPPQAPAQVSPQYTKPPEMPPMSDFFNGQKQQIEKKKKPPEFKIF